VGILIDATVLIAHERKGTDIGARIVGREEEPVLISVITVSELLHGVHRAEDRVRRARRSAFVEAVIDAIPILPVDLPTARIHAELHAELRREGRPVGPHDLWLAAAAVAHGLTLATANVRELGRVPGLELEEWS
jgi:tRNA(fMet)-specific endonuclease VapC